MKITVRQCAWCGAIKVDGVFKLCPVIKVLPGLLVQGDGTEHVVSHGICEPCKARVQREEAE